MINDETHQKTNYYTLPRAIPTIKVMTHSLKIIPNLI